MTRANLNYIIGEKTLSIYWNGDQYPRGLRDFFGLMALLYKYYPQEDNCRDYNRITKKVIVNYILAMYDEYTKKSIKEVDKPIIEDTEDYGYVFDFDKNNFMVYEWGKLVFEGNKQKFINFLMKKK
jgi:hypothetical protein